MNASKAVFEYLKARRPELSPSTRCNDRNVLLDLAAFVGDSQTVNRALTTRRIERWRGSKDWSPGTDRLRLSRVRQFCKWLVQNGYLKRDPSAGLKAPTQPVYVPRGLNAEEVAAVYQAAPDARGRLIVSLMVQEALRCMEVASIETGDIDHRERSLLVKGKGRRERVVPISDETWGLLTLYLRERGMNVGPLIQSHTTGRAITPRTIGKYVSDWMVNAGVKHAARDGKSAHALRHTSATDMLRGGAHLIDVQAALGHSSLEITRRYLPNVVAGLRDAMGGRSYLPGAEGAE